MATKTKKLSITLLALVAFTALGALAYFYEDLRRHRELSSTLQSEETTRDELEERVPLVELASSKGALKSGKKGRLTWRPLVIVTPDGISLTLAGLHAELESQFGKLESIEESPFDTNTGSSPAPSSASTLESRQDGLAMVALLHQEITEKKDASIQPFLIEEVMKLDAGRVPDEKLRGGAGAMMIDPLYEALRRSVETTKKAARLFHRAYEPDVRLWIHPEVHHRTVEQLLYTLGQSELSEFYFVVRTPEGLRELHQSAPKLAGCAPGEAPEDAIDCYIPMLTVQEQGTQLQLSHGLQSVSHGLLIFGWTLTTTDKLAHARASRRTPAVVRIRGKKETCLAASKGAEEAARLGELLAALPLPAKRCGHAWLTASPTSTWMRSARAFHALTSSGFEVMLTLTTSPPAACQPQQTIPVVQAKGAVLRMIREARKPPEPEATPELEEKKEKEE